MDPPSWKGAKAIDKNKHFRFKYGNKDKNASKCFNWIQMFWRPQQGLLSCTELFSVGQYVLCILPDSADFNRILGGEICSIFREYLMQNNNKHRQKANITSLCRSHKNYFASPLSIRALSCSLPQAHLDQGLWCWPAPGHHSRATACGQQHS